MAANRLKAIAVSATGAGLLLGLLLYALASWNVRGGDIDCGSLLSPTSLSNYGDCDNTRANQQVAVTAVALLFLAAAGLAGWAWLRLSRRATDGFSSNDEEPPNARPEA